MYSDVRCTVGVPRPWCKGGSISSCRPPLAPALRCRGAPPSLPASVHVRRGTVGVRSDRRRRRRRQEVKPSTCSTRRASHPSYAYRPSPYSSRETSSLSTPPTPPAPVGSRTPSPAPPAPPPRPRASCSTRARPPRPSPQASPAPAPALFHPPPSLRSARSFPSTRTAGPSPVRPSPSTDSGDSSAASASPLSTAAPSPSPCPRQLVQCSCTSKHPSYHLLRSAEWEMLLERASGTWLAPPLP